MFEQFANLNISQCLEKRELEYPPVTPGKLKKNLNISFIFFLLMMLKIAYKGVFRKSTSE